MTAQRDFWSRRKAQVEAEAEAERAADLATVEAAELEAREAQTDEELLADLKLPDPDSLGEGDDFRGFMAKAVPDRLRRRALRKLWLTNPVLANVDGLVDYGEDFTDAACVIENMQTAYQVGRGMTKHVEEMARQAALEAEANDGVAEEESTCDEGETDILEEIETPPEPDAMAMADDDFDTAPPLQEEGDMVEDIAFVATRQRMHFQFDDHTGDTA